MKNRKQRPYCKTVHTSTTPAMTEDGEVYDSTKVHKIVVDSSEDFFMFYGHLATIVSKGTIPYSDLRLLVKLMEQSAYNNEEVILTRPNKDRICEETGLSLTSIERSIANLTKLEILVKDKRYPRGGKYLLDPTYVWKGNSSDRKKALKTVIEMRTSHLGEHQIKQDQERYISAMGYTTTNS